MTGAQTYWLTTRIDRLVPDGHEGPVARALAFTLAPRPFSYSSWWSFQASVRPPVSAPSPSTAPISLRVTCLDGLHKAT